MSETPEPDPKLIEILVCPVTKGPLVYDREKRELISRQAGLAYPIRDGIPIMLADEARELSDAERDAKMTRTTPAERPWPTELRLDPAKTTLAVAFDSGEHFALPAEYLRVESPSAEVQGHGPSQKQIVGGKRAVRIATIEPVGNYAVRLIFDDGHDTGLYSWDYLHELGREQDKRWSDYLDALRQRGLSRD